ncbi:MAG: M20/M25/M40 family metallo-hydrolase [Pseudomonadota bacterium]
MVKNTTEEILELAKELIRIPSVTNCPEERLDEVWRAARCIADFLQESGVKVRLFDQAKYPALFAWFDGQQKAPVMLSGHFDVVEPFPDDSQFDPVVRGDFLWGRGSTDMKTVVATYLVWFREMAKRSTPYPPINMLLVGNEEPGEFEPTGTPHVLDQLKKEIGYEPELMVVGERTGENGDELAGKICVENRGIARMCFTARGQRGHTGTGEGKECLVDRLIRAHRVITEMMQDHLTLESDDDWVTGVRFPFVNVGTHDVYNITADQGHLGLEIRAIPQDNLERVMLEIKRISDQMDLELIFKTREGGVACDSNSVYLAKLKQAVADVFGNEPVIGRKMAGTSGRFAPGGRAIIWGQSGIGPHSSKERHYIPSIKGYYDSLTRFADLLR